MKKFKTTLLLLGSISLVSAMDAQDRAEQKSNSPVIHENSQRVNETVDAFYRCENYEEFKNEVSLIHDSLIEIQDGFFNFYLKEKVAYTKYEYYSMGSLPNRVKQQCIQQSLSILNNTFRNTLQNRAYRDGVPHPFLERYFAEEGSSYEVPDLLTEKYITREGK